MIIVVFKSFPLHGDVHCCRLLLEITTVQQRCQYASRFETEITGDHSRGFGKEIELEGDKTRLYWTLRALARAGFAVVEKADRKICIQDNQWCIGDQCFGSIEELLQAIS